MILKNIFDFSITSQIGCLYIFLAFLQYVSNYLSSKVLIVQSNWEGEFRPIQKKYIVEFYII